jgi:hypothetical protein
MDTDVIVIVCPAIETVETDGTVTVATVRHVEAERVTVEIGGEDEALGHALQVVGHALVEVLGLDEVLGDEVLVLVLDPAKQEHALDSLDAEAEHGNANAGIEGAEAIV